jgi:hypothetical protein
LTKELALRLSIGRFNVAAYKATLTGVRRVNSDHGHALKLCFVFDKGSQLCERPIAVLGSVLFAFDPCPLTNSGQVFNRYSSLRVYGSGNKSLADNVVGVGLKTGLLTTKFLQLAPGGLRTLALQFVAHPLMALTILFNRGAREVLAVTGSGDVGHAHIDAKKAINIGGVGRFFFAGSKQVELATNQAKVCFTVLTLQQVSLVVAANEGDSFPASQCPDANELLVGVPTEDSIIVGDAAMQLEGALRFLVQLVPVRNFGDAPHDQLGGQPKVRTNVGVDKLVQVVLSEGLLFPSNIAYLVARFVRPFKRKHQEIVLMFGWLKLHFRRQFHGYIGAQMFGIVKCLTAVNEEVQPWRAVSYPSQP